MKRLSIVLFALLLLVMVGGVVLLATTNIPAPSGTVEKVLPDDRFSR
jgi:hypothetical protein